jgi:hypothetical protein
MMPKPPRVPGSLVVAVVIVVEIDGFRIAQRAQAVARLGCGEAVAAQDVQIPVLERGQPGHVLVPDVVALGAELDDGGMMYRVVQSTTAFKTRPSEPN